MKTFFVNTLLVMCFVVICLTVFGCHGLGETADERSQDHARQKRLHKQMLVDDVDAILLKDRPQRLSEYTVR